MNLFKTPIYKQVAIKFVYIDELYNISLTLVTYLLLLATQLA